MATDDRGDADAARLRRAIAALEAQMLNLAHGLLQLERQVRAGDPAGLADARARTGEIRQWLDMALEMEARLGTIGRERQRDGTDGPLDLDAVRDQIGCRLDRLRRTRCPGRVPE